MTSPKLDSNGNRIPLGRYFTQEGQAFGRWTVVDNTRVSGNGKVTVTCRCTCGTVRQVSTALLCKGRSRSCGCLAAELSTERGRKHGGAYSAEYEIWRGMLQRCKNPKAHAYSSYGGRGITVCDAWLDFAAFIADMGCRPSPQMSIDRRDNDGPYAPWNCYWATHMQQNNNTRN